MTGRDYSTAALLGKLRSRGFSPELAEAAVVRLCGAGLLDDRRYAERFSATALETGRYAGYRLRMELRRRGVPGEVIDAVMAAREDDAGQGDTIRGLLERRFPDVVRDSASERDKRRAVQFLQRRGFSLGEILNAIREPEQF